MIMTTPNSYACKEEKNRGEGNGEYERIWYKEEDAVYKGMMWPSQQNFVTYKTLQDLHNTK